VLSDVVARNALDLATDRTAIIKSVLYGYATSSHGPLPISSISKTDITTSSSSNTSDTGRIADARALLEKNGWRKNISGIYEKKSPKAKTASTTLSFDIYTADAPDLVATAHMLKDQWNALGAHVDVQIFGASDLYQNIIRTRKYDALLFGEQIGTNKDLYAFWHSSERNAPGLNVSLYTNSKVDGLLSDIRSALSSSTIESNYTKFDQLIRADVPAIFLYSPHFIYAIPKDISGIHLGIIGVPSDHWSSVRDWYRETEKVWNIFKK
jgi:ABC-type transport system substrate-binding protein